MVLYDFDYERPASFEQARTRLSRLGSSARLLAGGTDLVPNLRTEIAHPETVISLGAITPEPPACGPDGNVRIDVLTRLAAIANSLLIGETLPMLAASAGAVASEQIRHMATLGGNLCQETRCLYLNQKHDYQFAEPCYKRGGNCCYPYPNNSRETCWSVFMSDTAPALIALGADVEILGESGLRRIPLEALYTGSGINPLSLGHAEIVRAVIVPAVPANSGWGYHKSARRGGLEFGMAVIAVTVQLDTDLKTCTAARIVIGAVRERPVRAFAAERALTGVALTEDGIARVAAEAADEINPLPHHGFTRNYLRDNLRVYLRRALSSAVARAHRQQAPAFRSARTSAPANGTSGKAQLPLQTHAESLPQQRSRVLNLQVNGEWHEAAVRPRHMLLEVLRDRIGLTGTKDGCEQGTCGACTVLVDDKPVLACITPALECEGKQIRTVEGLANGETLSPLQQAFLDQGAVQCGFCTPGMLMSATALLEHSPQPTTVEIKKALEGNLCRCTGYNAIVAAVRQTSDQGVEPMMK